jgi:hypothetical protein
MQDTRPFLEMMDILRPQLLNPDTAP